MVSISRPSKSILNKMDTHSITCNLLAEAFLSYEATLSCGPMRSHESLEWESLIDELLRDLFSDSPEEVSRANA
jgi:hypothetical protein